MLAYLSLAVFRHIITDLVLFMRKSSLAKLEIECLLDDHYEESSEQKVNQRCRQRPYSKIESSRGAYRFQTLYLHHNRILAMILE